jgi:hypothetical protein
MSDPGYSKQAAIGIFYGYFRLFPQENGWTINGIVLLLWESFLGVSLREGAFSLF